MTLLPGVSLKAQPNAAAEQMGAGNPIIALSVSEKCAHLPSGQNAERSLRMKSSPQLIIHIWIKNIKNFIISRDCRQRLWLVFTNYQTLAVWIFLLKGWREGEGQEWKWTRYGTSPTVYAIRHQAEYKETLAKDTGFDDDWWDSFKHFCWFFFFFKLKSMVCICAVGRWWKTEETWRIGRAQTPRHSAGDPSCSDSCPAPQP